MAKLTERAKGLGRGPQNPQKLTSQEKRREAELAKYRAEQSRLDAVRDARIKASEERLRAFEAPWSDAAATLRSADHRNYITNVVKDLTPRRRRIQLGSLARFEEIQAALDQLSFQFGMIFTHRGYWRAVQADVAQYNYFHGVVELSCIGLEKGNRIRTMSILLARIADLQASGQSVLTDREADEVATILIGAYTRNVGVVTEADLEGELPKPRWTPSHKWRELDPKESAASYFNSEIAPLPMSARPSTTELSASQPEFYNALKSHCAMNKRHNRNNQGEIGRARALSEILPYGAQRPRPVRDAHHND